jgi:hypothetical protein
MRYSVTMDRGGWVIWDTITHRTMTGPTTSEEAQAKCREMNAACIVRRLDPPIEVDGWGPAGALNLWLRAEDGWWGQVYTKTGVRWVRAEDLRPRQAQSERSNEEPPGR